MVKTTRREALKSLLGATLLSSGCTLLPEKDTVVESPDACVWEVVRYDWAALDDLLRLSLSSEGLYLYSRYGRVYSCVSRADSVPHVNR